MDIKLFKNALFEKAKSFGFSDCEIYYVDSKSLQVSVFNKEISQYKNSKVSGVSFRGHINGNLGYSYSEKIDLGSIDFLLKEASENASINESDNEMLNQESKILSFTEEYKKAALPEELINYALEMEKHAFEADSKVKNILHCTAGIAAGEVYIANSYGMELSQENSYCIAYVYVSVEDKGQVKVSGEMYYDKTFDKFSPKKTAEKAVEKALNALGAKIPESTKAKVLLKNEAAVDLMGTYLGNFYAENVQKGFSVLKDKIGEEIASPLVVLCDRASHPQALEALYFDSEGIMVKDKNVIEKGVLKTYLYNMKSAAKDGVLSTGNGFKGGFKAPVSTSCANLYMEPGEKDFEEMIKELDTGFIINDLSGLHAGTNAISGDFSLLAEGFYVEKGKIQYPVEQMTVAGNFYNILKDIEQLGSDLKFDLPGAGGSIGMPSMIIKNINISGQ